MQTAFPDFVTELTSAVRALPPLGPRDQAGLSIRLNLARAAKAAGGVDLAADCLSEVLVHHPAHAEAALLHIDALTSAGAVTRALAACDAALQHRPEDRKLLLWQARLLLRLKQPEAAEPVLAALIAGQPSDPGARRFMGQALYALGDREQAAGHFHAALDTAPLDHVARKGAIDCALSGGDVAAALDLLDGDRSFVPNGAVLDRVTRALIDDAGWTSRDAQSVADTFADGMSAEDGFERHVATGRAWFAAGRPSLARAAFGAAVAARPGAEDAALRVLDVQLELGDAEGALTSYQAATRDMSGQDLPAKLVDRAATALLQLHRARDAVATLEAALSGRAPKAGVPLRLRLAKIFRSLGDAASAGACYRAILDVMPEHKWAWLGRIDTALDEQDVDAALALCEQAEQAIDDDQWILRKRATAFRNAGLPARSLEILLRLQAERPDDLGLAANIGQLHLDLGDLAAAEAAFSAVRATDPTRAEAHVGLTEIAARQHSLALAADGATGPQGV